MIDERLASDVADYVMGFGTDDAEINGQMDQIARAIPLGWCGCRLWQFCFLTALNYDPQALDGETDERHVALMEKTARLVIPRLEVRTTRKTVFGLLSKTAALTTPEIVSALDDLLNALAEGFRKRLATFTKDGVASQSVCFQLRSDDPTMGMVALSIETVLCREYGFTLGSVAAANLHGIARMYLRMGPTHG